MALESFDSDRPLGFGIIGCGRIAPSHAQAIQALPEARLVAAADPVFERAQLLTETYGGRPLAAADALLERDDIDVVCICTPSGSHAELGVQAALAGKHVLVEKPMALSLADADRLIQTCADQGVKLGVVHQNRFNPPIVRLREAVSQGRFGQLNLGTAVLRWHRDQAYYDQAPWRGTWAQDGGCLMNQTIHVIDLLLWLMGPVATVSAFTATRLRQIEAEDTAVAALRFASGALGLIESTVTVYPRNLEETLNLFGAEGTAIIGGVALNRTEVWQFADRPDEEGAPAATDAPDPQSVYGSGHRPLIADFIAAVKRDREPAVNGHEGRKALELILAIYQASETGQPVELPLRGVTGEQYLHS